MRVYLLSLVTIRKGEGRGHCHSRGARGVDVVIRRGIEGSVCCHLLSLGFIPIVRSCKPPSPLRPSFPSPL